MPESKHKPGLVIHTLGYPLDTGTYGGGFLYHMADRWEGCRVAEIWRTSLRGAEGSLPRGFPTAFRGMTASRL